MAVHRDGYEDWSLFPPSRRSASSSTACTRPELIVTPRRPSQAITSRRQDGKPLTLEAGIIRVADALGLAEVGSYPVPAGRAVHSLSATAIEGVEIKDGETAPVLIEITMNNSSGIYQVDELLKPAHGSGLEPYVEVVAHIDTGGREGLIPLDNLEPPTPARRLQWPGRCGVV